MTETTEMTAKALEAMEDEVEAYCREKGWHEREVPFQVALSLLHGEAAEVGSAWRIGGVEDMTAGSAINPGGNDGAKPEGVGSELADLVIRLLDDDRRYGLGLAARAERYPGVFALSGEFLHEVNTLHDMISLASLAWQGGGDDHVRELAKLLCFVQQMAGYYQVDLMAEYTRKMKYNLTCAHKHGGKRY
jgi:NTP pyrophosphatase (non-canonical NTP hydrolase)